MFRLQYGGMVHVEEIILDNLEIQRVQSIYYKAFRELYILELQWD